jgi:hypothetical protein
MEISDKSSCYFDCKIDPNNTSPANNRAVLVCFQPTVPTSLQNLLEELVDVKILKKLVVIYNLLIILKDGESVEIHIEIGIVFLNLLKPMTIGANGSMQSMRKLNRCIVVQAVQLTFNLNITPKNPVIKVELILAAKLLQSFPHQYLN